MEALTRILVVDDELLIGDLIAELLNENDVRVTQVGTPKEALAELERHSFRLLITDLHLPEMGGHRLIEKAKEIDPELPVVIVTGYGSLESAVEALRQGVDDYLTKPFDLKSLTRVVERVLRTHRLVSENSRLVAELKRANEALRAHRDRLQHQVADATRDLTRMNGELKSKVRDLSLIQRIHRIGSTTDELTTLLNESLEITCRTLDAELGSILLLEESSQELKVAATFGERHKPILDLRRPTQGGIVGLVTDEDRLFRDDRRSQTLLSGRRKYRTRHFLSAPLRSGRRGIGVINLSDPESRHPFSGKSARLLDAAARELGLLIDRILHERSRQTNTVNTIRTLVESLEAKAPYFRGHSERVAHSALELAQRTGLGEADQLLVQRASYLHDVGKIGIPDRVLHKKGKLTDKEFSVIREHPVIGADLIRHFGFLENARPLIRHHHERWDGKGYPDGLRQDEIPFLASVITVADAYDAMLSARPYRKELTRDIAKRELVRGAGTQFHPTLVRTFCSRSPDSGWRTGTGEVANPLGAATPSWTEDLKRIERGGRPRRTEGVIKPGR